MFGGESEEREFCFLFFVCFFFFFSHMWTLTWEKKEDKFGIKNHINPKCMKIQNIFKISTTNLKMGKLGSQFHDIFIS